MPEQKSKSARQLLATLDSVGINNEEVKNLIAQADARVEQNYFYFDEQPAMGGKLALRLNLNTSDTTDPMGKNKLLELNYAPNDSQFQVTARTDGVMVSYHLNLQ